ncbi:MAG: aminotransferase class V-fold PLP-dependent enzyme [Pseudomonadota bacterium]
MTDRIYLDHAATSPLRPEAKRAMEEGFALWANPSSPHAEGRKAKQALEDARDRIKRSLGWDGEVIFTSGASEALWIALNRSKAKRRIVSAVEHDAVFRAAPDAEVVPIDPSGEFAGNLDVSKLEELLADPEPAVVAIQHINSEVGLDLFHWLRPNYVRRIRDAGHMLLADCSQSAGKKKLPDAHMIVISAHKFGGPIGIGALLVEDFALLEPGGGHERGYRQGTENLPAVLGMAAALELGGIEGWLMTDVERQRAFEWFEMASHVERVICPERWPEWIFAIAHESKSANAMLIGLDREGIAVSAGSACSSGTLKKSRVLNAFGVPDDVAARTIRVSLGWSSTYGDIENFIDAWYLASG